MSDVKQMLSFDGDAARRIERTYLTPDIVAQREQVLAEVQAKAGETILDIGVGPGLLSFDLAERVGEAGRVLGNRHQRSDGANDSKALRLAALGDLRAGGRLCDPLPACVHRLRRLNPGLRVYVPDMPRALQELFRVLTPGGRAVILDTDYDSLVLHSEKPELTNEILQAWDAHFVHRDLPRQLSRLLRQAGFELQRRLTLLIVQRGTTTRRHSATA